MSLRRIVGCILALAGLAVLAALGVAIYDAAASAFLVDLGIPGALLTALAGLALIFSGGALALSKQARPKS